MDRFRRRKAHARVSSPAKVTTIVDRTSDNRLITIYREGNQLSRKHNNLPKPTFDSSSCSSGASAAEDLLTFDLERSSERLLPTGTPMKKLLADEMSKETESKRRSPSIIARLMGLDGLPAQQNTSKQQHKRVPDNYQRDSGSSRFRTSGELYDSRSYKKGTKGQQQQFKDVYEVPEFLNMESKSNLPAAAFSPKRSKDEIAFIRQKFMDVKSFSTDVKLQHSKEFHDALQVLDSNKDLVLKFLQEPDSLFAKHLHELHGTPDSHCQCVSSMKSTNNLKCEIDALGCQSGRRAFRKIDTSHEHWDDCYDNMHHRRSVDSHILNFPEEGDDANLFQTNIVVLKPNLGKVQNTTRSVSSPSPSHAPMYRVELRNDCPNEMYHRSGMRVRRSAHNDSDTCGHKSRESRELARQITQRMRNKMGIDSFNASLSGYKGYLADESSHDMSENDSSCESEVTNASPQTLLNSNISKTSSASQYMESSVSREAKKRLSERWKMTHKSQEVGVSGKCGTLAEMLAIPDTDIKSWKPEAVVAQDECFYRFERNEGSGELAVPLGISSRDGWKDGCIQKLSRSRSLPASSSHLGSHRSNTRREALAAERLLVRKDNTGHKRSKLIRRDSERKKGSHSATMGPNNARSLPSCPVSRDMINDIREVQFSEDTMTNSLGGKDSPEIKAVILEMSSCRHDSTLALDAVVDKEHKNVSESRNCPNELEPASEISSGILSEDDSSTYVLPSVLQEPSTNYDVRDSSCLNCAATQPESPASSKESEQPSPVSVLEAPFVEDLSSSSECFERVSAELHGLRKQLQLLKLESEAYDEGSMLISSDEDGEESTEFQEDNIILQVGQTWEYCYLVDLLTKSGLVKTNPDSFLRTWHSPDCPIGLWVFDKLEEKYGGRESCLRSERRLLFDRINYRIVEITQQFVDLHPWVMPRTRNIGSQWLKDGFKTELHKLVENYKKATEDEMDVVILSNIRWLELRDHIDFVGRHIEGLLMDELVAEILPL